MIIYILYFGFSGCPLISPAMCGPNNKPAFCAVSKGIVYRCHCYMFCGHRCDPDTDGTRKATFLLLRICI